MYNGSSSDVTSGIGVNVSFRMGAQFTGSASDYIKCGSVEQSASAGNLAGGGQVELFCRGDGATRFGHVSIAEAFAFLGTPTARQRRLLDAYCWYLYGDGLT